MICKAITQSGTRCRREAVEGEEYCLQHLKVLQTEQQQRQSELETRNEELRKAKLDIEEKNREINRKITELENKLDETEDKNNEINQLKTEQKREPEKPEEEKEPGDFEKEKKPEELKQPKYFLKEIPEHNYFKLSDGKVIKDISEMLSELKNMDDNVFDSHINEERNDIANWIRDVFKDVNFAERIRKATDKKKIIRLLEKKIKRAKKQFKETKEKLQEKEEEKPEKPEEEKKPEEPMKEEEKPEEAEEEKEPEEIEEEEKSEKPEEEKKEGTETQVDSLLKSLALLQEVAEDVADKLKDVVIEDSSEFQRRVLNAAMAKKDFRESVIRKLVRELR